MDDHKIIGKRGNLKQRNCYNRAIREIFGSIATVPNLNKIDGLERTDVLDFAYLLIDYIKMELFPLVNSNFFFHLVYMEGKYVCTKDKLLNMGFSFTKFECMCFCNQFKNYIVRIEDGLLTVKEAYNLILKKKHLWHFHSLVYISKDSPLLKNLNTIKKRSQFIQEQTNAIFGNFFGPAYTYMDIVRIALYIQNSKAQEKGVHTHCFQYLGDAVSFNRLFAHNDSKHRDLTTILKDVIIEDKMLADIMCPRCMKAKYGYCRVHAYAERLNLTYL